MSITVQHITKSFGSFVALNDVSLTIPDGQLVAHDEFLDGSTFGSSNAHVSKKWYVGELMAGVGVIWHGVRITYTQTWQTEEFHGQKGGLFNFGSLALSTRF